MTERVLGPTGGRRRKRLAFFVPVLAIAALILAIGASATGPVGTASGFQDDDGNLIDDGAGIDWNNFDAGTNGWLGTAPNRTRDEFVDGWKFKGLEDAQATTSDSAFAGGTKQDDNCATVNTGKAPNKDDLKRAYVSSKIVGGDVFLNLAWVRIPQNTTSPSAHIGFEFNQGETACATGGLVSREEGDLLFVYDFEGGTTDVPTISLREWILTGACEVANQTAPCWGPATNLTLLGFAEAKVNTSATALDQVAPSDETLGINEFGEAGINLSDAGVFAPGECDSFGTVFAVSRSSGNSGTAQMKDIAGPGDFELTNCGTVTIIKHTSPPGVDQDFDFTSTLAGTEIDCSDDTPGVFTLNDSGTDTLTCSNVPAGSYTVTEGDDPTGFAFADLSCSATGTGTSATPPSGNATRVASITMAGGGAVTCTYTNNQQLGAIKITKTTIKTGAAGLAGAEFTITGPNSYSNTVTSGADGTVCVENLAFGAYTVTETKAPGGYQIDDPSGQPVTVDTNTTCGSGVEETVSFTDTPLTDLTITVASQATGGTQSTIRCTDGDAASFPGTDIGDSPAALAESVTVTAEDLEPGYYTCEVFVDP